MKKIIEPKDCRGGVLPGPQPIVLVTCGTYANPNIITISYFGQISDGKIYIAVRPSRYSNSIIKKQKEFAVNYVLVDNVKEVDYCGGVSGRKANKFKETNLTKEKGLKISCPLIKQSPLILECKLDKVLRVGKHDLIIADVINVIKRKKDKNYWLFMENFFYKSTDGKSLGRVFEIAFEK